MTEVKRGKVAAMQVHVMPSFPHALIGLGPFADLGCQIIFTKMAVSVIQPNGHIILEGWREQDGPRLWRFLLNATKASLSVPALYENYEEPGPCGSAANFFIPPLANLIEQPSEVLFPPSQILSIRFIPATASSLLTRLARPARSPTCTA